MSWLVPRLLSGYTHCLLASSRGALPQPFLSVLRQMRTGKVHEAPIKTDIDMEVSRILHDPCAHMRESIRICTSRWPRSATRGQ